MDSGASRAADSRLTRLMSFAESLAARSTGPGNVRRSRGPPMIASDRLADRQRPREADAAPGFPFVHAPPRRGAS
eukprot:11159747-Lingulodinium_polyedra.AAC.1